MLESLYFSEEHEMLRDMVREFAQNEVAPLAIEIDRESKFPVETVQKMGELGLMGIPWSEEYGGTGMDTLAQVIAVEELGKVCVSTAATMMAHTSLGTGPMYLFGSEEQKKKYIPQLASGEILGAFGLTEPNAGSDAGATQTKAVLDGDEFVVNGQKVFCTNAGYASLITFTAQMVENGENKGVAAFFCEKDATGFSLGPPEHKMGWRGSDTRSIYFEDMRIPKANLLGDPAKGFGQFLQTLDGGRITISALSLGAAQGAFDIALKYSQERDAFGKKIGKFQGVSFKLSDMATSIEAGKQLTYHAAWMKDQGKNVGKEAAMAKLFTSEAAMRISTDAIQLLGGYGYIKEYEVERFFRDSKVLEIGEGTSEVQRIVIYRNLLKTLNI